MSDYILLIVILLFLIVAGSQQRDEPTVLVGQEGPCGVTIPLSAWPEMNKAGVYRWVVACEKSTETIQPQPKETDQ